MLIYNRPYIILVARGDRAYVNLHPWKQFFLLIDGDRITTVTSDCYKKWIQSCNIYIMMFK